jgi:succinate dehydrogenase/fumarate reductase cytochrome b subunit
MMQRWRELGKVALGLAIVLARIFHELSGLRLILVREGRLELPWVTPLDPKSSASASSATLALCQVFFGTVRMGSLPCNPTHCK